MIRLSCVEHPFRWRSFENVPSVNGRAHTNTQKYCQSSKCRHSFRMKLLKSHQLSLISLPFARISFTEIDNESLTQTCLPAHYIITSERGFVFFFIFLFRCFCWWAVAFFFSFPQHISAVSVMGFVLGLYFNEFLAGIRACRLCFEWILWMDCC